MHTDDIRKIQASFSALKPRADEVGLMFYDRLFATHPGLRGMFPEDIAPQSKKLVHMLALVVNSLDRLDALLPAVEELARRHNDYGVRPEHYPLVGETLLWTLAKGLGPSFSDDLKAAWSSAFALLSGAMIAASARA